jgi:hypothetical protein
MDCSYLDGAAAFMLVEKTFQSPFIRQQFDALKPDSTKDFIKVVLDVRNPLVEKNKDRFSTEIFDREIANLLERDFPREISLLYGKCCKDPYNEAFKKLNERV